MKLRIEAVFELDGTTPKHQSLVGREGNVFYTVIIDKPFFLVYTTEELLGKALRTSYVTGIDDSNPELLVFSTKNSVYAMRCIEEKENK